MRAQAKAGDLAHGLKTPLAVLAQDAARAEREGHAELAASIRREVEGMRRQVDSHLAQARAAASAAAPGAQCLVAASAEPLGAHAGPALRQSPPRAPHRGAARPVRGR